MRCNVIPPMFLVSSVNSYFLPMDLPSQVVVGDVLAPGGAQERGVRGLEPLGRLGEDFRLVFVDSQSVRYHRAAFAGDGGGGCISFSAHILLLVLIVFIVLFPA